MASTSPTPAFMKKFVGSQKDEKKKSKSGKKSIFDKFKSKK